MDIQSFSGVLLYVVAFLIVFAESGVFFLFFLPGDSLLFALGLLANKGSVSLWHLIPLLIVAAILGNILGYFLGAITRGRLEKGKYIPKVRAEHLKKAEIFYTRYGVFAVLFARFVPIIRTVVPFFAGVVSMNRKTYTVWSIIGGISWITIVTLVGYFFGKGFALQNVAFLGVGAVVAAVVATPVFLVLIKRFVK